MNRNRIGVIGLIALGLATPSVARAQFSASYQTNIISGVVSNWAGDYYVGSNAVCDALQVINGATLGDNSGYIGYIIGDRNNVLVSGNGSVWSNQGNLYVGRTGNYNSLIVDNGGTVLSSNGLVGYLGSYNKAVVTGKGSVWSNQSSLRIGLQGGGNSLVISNGGRVVNNSYVLIGPGLAGESNNVLVTGAGSGLNSGIVQVGELVSRNSLVISNAGAVIDDIGVVGGYRSSYNTVLVTGYGSAWNNSLDLRIGGSQGGPGNSGNQMMVSNGGNVYSGNGCVGYAGSNNTVLVSGNGSVWSNQSSLSIGYNGTIGNLLTIASGGTVVASNVVVEPNNSVILSGGSLVAFDGLVVSNGAALKGSGMIQANLILAGTLAPGNSAGAITNFGNLTLQSSAMLDMELGGRTQGSDYDYVLVNGNVTLGGSLRLSFINGFETNVLNSDTFTLLSSTNVLSGSFTDVLSGQRLTTAGGEGSFLVDYSGHSIVLSNYQVIPEPGALALCMFGLVGLLVSRRQKVRRVDHWSC